MINRILCIFCFVILSLIFTRSSYAVVYFYDDFSSNNLEKWDVGPSSVDNSWFVANGSLTGTVSRGNWSKLFAKWNDDQSIGDYILTADVINKSGVDQVFYVRVSNDKSKYYQIGYRYNEPSYTVDSNNITLFKFNDGVELVGYYPSVEIPRTFHLTQNVVNKIKIILSGNSIKVYFNDVLAIDYSDNSLNPILKGGIGLLNWSGACPGVIENVFDNIYVSSLGDSTPPAPKNKIIIIPGLGASWNTQALVYNDTVPDNSWTMTPFVNNYKKLISSLEKNGLVKDQDFFVWNYDWRRPVSEIVAKLDTFIDQNVDNDEKVSLVGHSLGSLTARIWAQNNSSDARLNKVIGLGGPQLGAVDAYDVWNGAKIDNGDISGIALNVLLTLQKNKKPTKIETIRSFAPVLKDLLPVFDFVKQDNKVKKFTDLNTVNNYLSTANLGYSGITDMTSLIIGVGESTKEWINLGKSGIFDKVLGIWPDGKPTGYKLGNGDDTVLKMSGILGDKYTELVSNHGDVVDKSLGNIISELGLSEVDSGGWNNDLKNKLVYFIGSPAELNVSCDGKPMMESNSDGFVITEGIGVNKCRITVIGTGNGIYHLVTGRSGDQESFRYFENEIGVGQTETIIVDGTSGLPQKGENSDYLCRLIRKEVTGLLVTFPKDINLLGIKDAIGKCDIGKIEEKTFNFRKAKKETMVTDQIIGYIREILIGKNKINDGKLVKALWNKVVLEKRIIDELSEFYLKRAWKPTVFMSINYQKITEFIDDGNNALARSDYNTVLADMTIINHLILHFW